MSNFLNRPWAVLGAGALVVVGVVAAQNFRPGTAPFARQSPVNLRMAALNTGADLSNLKALDTSFAALSEAASQGVVLVTSDTRAEGENDVMSQLQGVRSGSGFVYRSDGWIVTNDHVVAGLDKVKIVLADGREMVGKVIHASDPQLDLAVFKLDAKDLPFLSLADSSQVKVGQLTVAIGAPFGLADTVTVGHVSAIGRPGQVSDGMQWRVYSGLIQTDASINPGNSGGPLVNVDGDVIGVNSAINTTTGSSAGIGFAIPSNVVKVVADELISKGKFDRGMLGVVPRDLKPFEMKEKNLQGGALVSKLEQDSPAYQQGIREGDIVTAIDGQPISKEIDLRIALYRHSPNDTVDVTYVRGGQSKSAKVKLEAVKATPATPRNAFPDGIQPFGQGQPEQQQNEEPQIRPAKPRLGVGVKQIDDNVRSQFSLPSDAKGVVVETVATGSFAAKVDLQPGDVILSVNGRSVNLVTDLTDAMAGVNWGDQVALKFVRFKGGSRQEFTVTVPFR